MFGKKGAYWTTIILQFADATDVIDKFSGPISKLNHSEHATFYRIENFGSYMVIWVPISLAFRENAHSGRLHFRECNC